MNPGQLHFLKLLGFDRVHLASAEGMHYTEHSGRRILDLFGGFGSLAYGHNHPRILAARQKFQDEKRHELAMAFMSQYAASLSRNLAMIAPDDLDIVFLTNCGSVANEAALKLAEASQPANRRKVLYASHSFHGKTRAALGVTDSDMYQASFQLLENRMKVPFGDAAALQAVLESNPDIGTFIVETVQGGAGIVLPPDDYFPAVRELCDKHDVLWLADEVQSGCGRTGRFFAFEHYGVAPDIITLAKSLGGGKTAIGAYIARTKIHQKAYGEPKNALVHGPATFSGMGEACVTAIEALNILYDEHLIERSASQGEYFLARLQELKAKYPKLLADVRGKGLMIGIEFTDISQTLPLGARQMVSLLDERLKGSLCGLVGSLLLREYGILVAFTEYNRNVIRIEPPLIIEKEHIDQFITAFDELLSKGVTGIASLYLKNKLR
jgi:acetylornithine/succinyldiaminopimelate/putrescine aminotransferase